MQQWSIKNILTFKKNGTQNVSYAFLTYKITRVKNRISQYTMNIITYKDYVNQF